MNTEDDWTETSISFSNHGFIFLPAVRQRLTDPLIVMYTATDILIRCVIGVAENSEDVMKMLTDTQKHNFQFIQN
ncbi:hypothetical protein [Pectobacterium brasiliense]|uniref:hypothetical protein n=1 Tax=Pectobacterium brasiliense TaxID=180957 RepID=UPI002A7F190E|nr:hypothetical protein [Pectobacterium brasiliense]MDY4350429.1 hypothetical protein [Pectobacterium brasiliense]